MATCRSQDPLQQVTFWTLSSNRATLTSAIECIYLPISDVIEICISIRPVQIDADDKLRHSECPGVRGTYLATLLTSFHRPRQGIHNESLITNSELATSRSITRTSSKVYNQTACSKYSPTESIKSIKQRKRQKKRYRNKTKHSLDNPSTKLPNHHFSNLEGRRRVWIFHPPQKNKQPSKPTGQQLPPPKNGI